MSKEEFSGIKRPIWDYLFYLSMLILTIWLILKVVGIIKSPLWLEYGIPIGTFIIGFFTLFQSLNNKIMNVDKNLSIKVANVGKDVELLNVKVNYIEKDIDQIKKRF